MTPTVIRNLIIAIWLTAGLLSWPAYLGFVWPDPAACKPTSWPRYETAVEVCMYMISSTLVIVVYMRIWNEVMHSEVHYQQQQPNWAAATTSGATSQSGGRGNVESGVRMLWHHRQLIRKHRATRTTMVILASFICLFFPYILIRVLGVAGLQIAVYPVPLVTSLISYLAYATNAFIYALFSRDFRDAFKRILCRGASTNSVTPLTVITVDQR